MRLTRNQRRQIDALAPHIERIVATDVAFFKQNPQRRHRVRLSSGAEVTEMEIVNGEPMRPPAGEAWFTIVRKANDGRVRVFITNEIDASTDLDVPEDLSRELFDYAAPPEAQETSQALGFSDEEAA
jgi:hypothetical protein